MMMMMMMTMMNRTDLEYSDFKSLNEETSMRRCLSGLTI